MDFQKNKNTALAVDFLAVRMLGEVYTLEVVRDFLSVNGLGMTFVFPLKRREVILGFESNGGMLELIDDGFLLQMFSAVEPCSKSTCARSFFTVVESSEGSSASVGVRVL